MAKEIYKKHPVVFYEEHADLYEAAKIKAKENEQSLTAFILTLIKKEVNAGGITTPALTSNETREIKPIKLDLTVESVDENENEIQGW